MTIFSHLSFKCDLGNGSFQSYSLSARSFRPLSFRSGFRGGSFRPDFGGSFRAHFILYSF